MDKKLTRKVTLWSIILPLLVGCGGSKMTGLRTVQGDPEILYKEGLVLFNKRDYPDAVKKFEQVKSNFPDNPPYTVWAEMKAADSLFASKRYVEAVGAYEDFKKIHPTHEEMPYIQYQIGMSYFNQMFSHDRDQTITRKALSSFEYLVANYSPSLFAEKAKEKINTCKDRLANNEFYVADFYYKRGKFLAAARRFEALLSQFPKMPNEDRTLFLLGKSYLELGQAEKARESFTKVVTEYPKSSHYKEAKGILGRSEKPKEPVGKAKARMAPDTEQETVALIKFEEEGKKPVSFREGREVEVGRTDERFVLLPAISTERVKPIPPKEMNGPMKEGRPKAIPQDMKPEKRSDENLKVPINPEEPGREEVPSESEPKTEAGDEEETRKAALFSTPPPFREKERRQEQANNPLDTGQPIDITSDSVESYSKDNLIIFKGNVTARQKDMVIYADQLEAVIIADGKGIEKVTADGNVKIQQGLRVANCQKAVFYNLDKKVVLTGDPKVWESSNMVSGDEIIFDIEQNQVEVKGGQGGRGKAKIQR